MNETPKAGLLFYTGKPADLSNAAMPPIVPRKPAVAFLHITLGHIIIAVGLALVAAAIYFRP